jgi:transposase
LEPSTISDAVSGVCRLLTPLVEALRHYVLVPAKLHVDAIPVPMLALSKGSTKTRRLWTYTR